MINLVFKGTASGAATFKLEYGKVDGSNPISFSTVVPYPTSLPYTVQNIPDGKYICRITPIKQDGTMCPVQEYTTAGCPNLLSADASYSNGNFTLNVSAVPTVLKVNVVISYPNGGNYNQILPLPGPFIIPKPTNVYGTFDIKVRGVCNAAENFYSDFTNDILLTVKDPGSVPDDYFRVDWGYFNTDQLGAINAGSSISFQFTGQLFNVGATQVPLNFTSAANDKYLVVKVYSSIETIKTKWVNTDGINYGDIPDQIWYNAIPKNGNIFYATKTTMSLDAGTQVVTFKN